MRQVFTKKRKKTVMEHVLSLVRALPIILALFLIALMWQNNAIAPTTPDKFPTGTPTDSPLPPITESLPAQPSDLSQCIQQKQQEIDERKQAVGEGSLLIQFHTYMTDADKLELLFRYPTIEIVKELRSLNGYSVSVPHGQETELACRLEIENLGKIEKVHFNTLSATN